MELLVIDLNNPIISYCSKDLTITFYQKKCKIYSSTILKFYSHFFEKMFSSNFKEKNKKKCNLLIDVNTFDYFYKIITGEKIYLPYLQINNLLYLLDFFQIKKKYITKIEKSFSKQIKNELILNINIDFIQNRFPVFFNKIIKYILEIKYLQYKSIKHNLIINKFIFFYGTLNDGINENNEDKLKIECNAEYIFCNQTYILLLQNLPPTSSSHKGNTVFCILNIDNLNVMDGKYLPYLHTNCANLWNSNIFINDKVFPYSKNKTINFENILMNKKIPGNIDKMFIHENKIYYVTSQYSFPEDTEKYIYSEDLLNKKIEYLCNLFYTDIFDINMFNNKIVYIENNNISYQITKNKLSTIDKKLFETNATCLFSLNNILFLFTLKYQSQVYVEIVNKKFKKVKSFLLENHIDIKKQQIDIIDQVIVIGDKDHLYFYNYQKDNVDLEYKIKTKNNIISVKIYHSVIRKISNQLIAKYNILVGFDGLGVSSYDIEFIYILDTI